ncbi:MAG: glycosyltransferase family 39 protein [Bacteroidota bacterium]
MNQYQKDQLFLLGLGILFFVPFLGQVHLFDWDEVNFAECAREMIESGNYLRVQINFTPFWEKPPLFFWFQALSMQVFGINEFAARLPNAIAGLLTLATLYDIGYRIGDRTFAWFWVLAYGGAILPHFYFHSGIIDPWFNLLIFLSLCAFIRAYWRRKYGNNNRFRFLFLGGIALGLAILAKGPVAGLIMGLVLSIYWTTKEFRRIIRPGGLIVFGFGTLIPVGLWFGIETLMNGPWFVETFIEYQIRLFQTEDAGHGGFPGYHAVVLLLGVFPTSLLALGSLFKPYQARRRMGDMRVWMMILFWVVLVLFSVVQSKIVHYSSLCYFPLSFMAALTLYRAYTKERAVGYFVRVAITVVGMIIGAVVIAIPVLIKERSILEGLMQNDPFALANIQAEVVWSGWEGLAGVWAILITIVGVHFLARKQTWRGALVLGIGTALFVEFALWGFVKRVEGYSQRAAIEYCQTVAEEDAYLLPVSYKSYAHLYYGAVTPETSTANRTFDELVKGEVDKDVYFIARIHKESRLSKYAHLQKVGSKNGFVLYKRPRGAE